MHTISIIDGRGPDRGRDIAQALESGRNFLVVLKPKDADLERLCQEVGCLNSSKPERLGRWGVHALNDVLNPADYEKLLKIQSTGDIIYFVEQLHLKHNRPPRLKTYMVYCEVRGIISDHNTIEEAKSSFFHYLESFRRARLFLMVGIYVWQDNEWVRMKSVF